MRVCVSSYTSERVKLILASFIILRRRFFLSLRISSDNISFINIENKTPFLLSTAASLMLSSQLRRLAAARGEETVPPARKTGFPLPCWPNNVQFANSQSAVCGRTAKYQLGTPTANRIQQAAEDFIYEWDADTITFV